jgi:putative ABC transport system permease protein
VETRLASVTERTREIGLRLAIGARQRDVLRQFLIEAVPLSIAGGAVGVGLGMFGATAIERSFSWSTYIPSTAVGVAFGFSVLIGIVFGYYPAFRGARLDPIEALRVG